MADSAGHLETATGRLLGTSAARSGATATGEKLPLAVRGQRTAVGLFQVRRLEPSFATAEWGFAIAATFWGSGMFVESARLVLDFVFDQIGATRLEARAALSNGRGHGALRKLGAVREGLLRKSFWRNGEHFDQVLWSILPEDRARPAVSSPVTLH